MSKDDRHIDYVEEGSAVAMGDNSIAAVGDVYGGITIGPDGPRIGGLGPRTAPTPPEPRPGGSRYVGHAEEGSAVAMGDHGVVAGGRVVSPGKPQPPPAGPGPAAAAARPDSPPRPSSSSGSTSTATEPRPAPEPVWWQQLGDDTVDRILALDEHGGPLPPRQTTRAARTSTAAAAPWSGASRSSTHVGGPPAEVTGLGSAKNFASGMAAAYAATAADVEQFVASLSGCGVSGAAIDAAQRAGEAQQTAEAAWRSCDQALQGQDVVAEAYAATPGAGSREFVTGE